jgi:hypothetical protein
MNFYGNRIVYLVREEQFIYGSCALGSTIVVIPQMPPSMYWTLRYNWTPLKLELNFDLCQRLRSLYIITNIYRYIYTYILRYIYLSIRKWLYYVIFTYVFFNIWCTDIHSWILSIFHAFDNNNYQSWNHIYVRIYYCLYCSLIVGCRILIYPGGYL